MTFHCCRCETWHQACAAKEPCKTRQCIPRVYSQSQRSSPPVSVSAWFRASFHMTWCSVIALATDMSVQSTLGDTDACTCKINRISQHKIIDKYYSCIKKADFGHNPFLRGIKSGNMGCLSVYINPVQKYSQCI